MKEEYCNIFNLCFPQFRMSYDRFYNLLHKEECVCFEYIEMDDVVAFAIIEDFVIRMICVTPEKQKMGFGTRLLEDIEIFMKSRKYEKIVIGGVSSRVFIGAVSESWGFFEKQGYQSIGGCDEMLLELKNFCIDDYELHGSDSAEYGWYEGDLNKIHTAVACVDESWVKYFNNFENIYVAKVNGKIASFCLVDLNCQNYLTDMYGRIGMPGCVGTVPEFRNRGVALEMIANVTEYLKKQGMDVSFIYFTGVSKWYEKIGYKTYLSEVFGIKQIEKG